ncbi:MAG: universal stress protein [Acidimicrobiales bacterium]|nr:universal stress protein [Acidimicrobiales bacterium]
MYTRLLVPVDGGERSEVALELAARLAAVTGAHVDVLEVVEPTDGEVRSQATTEVRFGGVSVRESKIVRSVKTVVGDEIAREVLLEGGTLVVMATAARGRMAGLVGSVAEDVMSRIDSPVLLVGPSVELPEPDAQWAGPMYVCTDSSDYSDRILEPAAEMCRTTGLHPWIISVGAPGMSDAAHEANHVANLAKRMGQMIGQTVDFDALHEKHVAEDIVDYATRGGASVIAMATHSKTGYKRIFEGSVSMEVVHDAHCPVLVVHPSS